MANKPKIRKTRKTTKKIRKKWLKESRSIRKKRK